MLSRWDAGWYVEIARDGYHYEPGTPSNAAFSALSIINSSYARSPFLPENDYWWLLTGIVLFNIALLVALGCFRSILAIDFDQETGISHHYLSPDLSDYFLFFLRLQ